MPMKNLSIVPTANPDEDIAIFAENCVFMRSIYLHGQTLFDRSTADDKDRMARTANTLFGDLSRMFVEYMILQVCKITDPAKDARNNDNHTVAFLLQHYDPRNGGWNTQNVHKILNYKAFMPRIRECGAVAPISTISTSYASAAVSRLICGG